MQSFVAVVGGLLIGLGVFAFWLTVDDLMDNLVISGLKVTLFWAALSVLPLFAYPTPELSTPSFEFLAAFIGVEMGIVPGAQQAYHSFHPGSVFCSTVILFRTMPAFVGRLPLRIPTILIMKFYGKTLAKCTLPVVSNCLCIPIKSTSYSPTLTPSNTVKMFDELNQAGSFAKAYVAV